ncbi:MAG: hypothetical protein LQ339_007580 [Xanthoria mediterranea]|nr:MAG: hypothetical protein LQ339_007580 [Xanthoria mediterranea]
MNIEKYNIMRFSSPLANFVFFLPGFSFALSRDIPSPRHSTPPSRVNITGPPSLAAYCDGARFGMGGPLNAGSCSKALDNIDRVGLVYVTYRGRGGPGTIDLPRRYAAEDQNCAIDLKLNPLYLGDTLDLTYLRITVDHIIIKCMLQSSVKIPTGGQVTKLGWSGQLSVTVLAPRMYDILCPYLPAYRPPLDQCQAALDLLPWGDEARRFGPATSAGVDVPLPRTYTAPHGRCAIEIDYQATGDVISWNEINDALAAVLVKCLKSGRQTGFVSRLGASRNIFVRVTEPTANLGTA